MSGIVGILHFDGARLDQSLLHRLAATMVDRGPDDLQLWRTDSVGLGHTLLCTTDAPADDRQPASLDGHVWIAADARIDDRASLAAHLEEKGRTAVDGASDAELILHAYAVWGSDCVTHFIGDFAFAIWDSTTRRLFCARDHFGIKPFYYARFTGGIVFGNTLECVCLHPRVGRGLREAAIGDFLLFGNNEDLATTTFVDVSRLPPAHTLTCEEGRLRTARYWNLPTDGRIRYRRPHDYVAHFSELLRAAIADRLRTRRVGVWMSGGIDSTSVAAAASALARNADSGVQLRAHTVVYDRLIPDQERRYAALAGEALGIDVTYFVADDHPPFEGWDLPAMRAAEPHDDVFRFMRQQLLVRAASESRVMLCGEGGDEILCRSLVTDLATHVPPLELIAGVARSLLVARRRPAIGLRAKIRAWRGRGDDIPPFPCWLNSGFAARHELVARWRHVLSGDSHRDEHPFREEAYRRLAAGPWSWYFESFDPGATRVPVEGRYPLLDVRLVSYLLAIPPLPWFIDKQILRTSMRHVLPDPVRLRPKAPLAGDPLREWLNRADWKLPEGLARVPEVDDYVDRRALPEFTLLGQSDDPSRDVRPWCLDFWLTHDYGRRTSEDVRICLRQGTKVTNEGHPEALA